MKSVESTQSAPSASTSDECTDHSTKNTGDNVDDHLSSSAGKEISLPNYSTRILDVLAKGQVLLDFDHFIEETAYHVLAHGDMTSKADYEAYGKRLLLKYPCLEFPGRKNDWVNLHAKLLL